MRKSPLYNSLLKKYGYYRPFFNKDLTRKDKKYSVFIKDNNKTKIIHYGQRDYQHFKDTTPDKVWSNLNHNDLLRRTLYRKRASQIKNLSGKLTFIDRNSPNYWSYHTLW